MKKMLGLFAILASAAIFTGCASGPKYSAVKSSFQPLAQNNGRIFFYRASTLGAALNPDVKLNGEVVGTAKAKGFFYTDRPAGNYEVETSTEISRRLTLQLEQGQTRYVRFNVSMGFFVGHVYPELVETATGEEEIQKCSYTGGK
jgi:hypothetical protein